LTEVKIMIAIRPVNKAAAIWSYDNIVRYVSKNGTDVAHYNLNAHQPVLIIFGRDVAERISYRAVI